MGFKNQRDYGTILKQLCSNMEQASAALVSRSQDPPDIRLNVWSLIAAKLRIVQMKLEKWTQRVAHNGGQSRHNDQTAIAIELNQDSDSCQSEVWMTENMMKDFDIHIGLTDYRLWMGWDEKWDGFMTGDFDATSYLA